MPSRRTVPAKKCVSILDVLAERFAQHEERHGGVAWRDVEARLKARPAAVKALEAMEETGGEPDVIAWSGPKGTMTFGDCSAESPAGRRSLCYDEDALEARKEHKPRGSAVGVARAMGIALMTEEQYRALQEFGEFDRKTSSWLATPPDFRALGGALFGDRRYDRVFVYHNGAESYFAARGFRGVLHI